mgnify:CR=1 FL=1
MTKAAPKAHAKLSASSSERWLNCPGSIALIDKAPPPRESKYALEGTTAHECMEKMLLNEMTVQGLIDKYGSEMVAAVVEMKHAVESRMVLGTEKMIVETKVKFPMQDHEGNEMFGTVDCAILDLGHSLVVMDYKHGAGVAVEPEKNLQMIYYAIALADKYHWNFNTVELVIVQPRAFHEQTTRSWTLTIEELQNFVIFFEKGIARLKSKPRLFAGKWCKFCAASVICPEQTAKALQAAKIAFDEPLVDNMPRFPEVRDLTPDQISMIMQKADILESWINEVRAYAEDVLNRGGNVPGFKLVEKRGSRKWSNPLEVEKDAADAFGSKAYSRELLSPAQMEKVAGKDWVSPRTVTVSSGLTMVDEGDKRPAVNPTQNILTGFDEPITEGVSNEKDNEKSSEKVSKKTSKKSASKKVDKKVDEKSDAEDCGF